MAEVNDRGQLLLIAGILLAVVFVALALLVNAAIYTENVATRGGDSAGEALKYQAEVTDSVGKLIDAENAEGRHDNRSDIRGALGDGIDSIDVVTDQNHLRRGAATRIETGSVSAENTTDGVLIRQSDSSEIANWTVDDASGVRAFEMEFESGSVESEPFNITLGSTELFIYENDTNDDLVVARDTVGNEICSADAEETVRFEITDGRFGENPCRFELSDVDEVRLQNNGSVNGGYDVTVATSDAEGFPEGVRATEAIYSADLGLRINTPELHYQTTVRVAPGESDA